MLIKIVLNLRTQTKLIRCFKQNWKVINTKKFNNIIKRLLFELLLDATIERKNINEYTIALLKILKKIIENFISWARSYKRIKFK